MRYIIALFFMSCLAASASAAGVALPMPIPAFVSGLRADSNPCGNCFNVVIFEPGSFTEMYGKTLWSVPDTISVDLGATGAGGRDRVAPFGDGQSVFFFLLADPSGNVVGLASPGYNYGDVIVPAGYTMLRKHPFMINYRNAWGGIPSFHFSGIQNPSVDFSLFSTSSTFAISVPQGAANQPVAANLSPLMPVAGGARLARLRYAVYATGGVAGTAYISADGSHWIELGAANPALGGATWGDITVRCQSDGTVYVMRNTTGISLSLFLEGYVVTEVTN